MVEFRHLTDAEVQAKARPPLILRAVGAVYDEDQQGIAIRFSNGVAAFFPLDKLPGLEHARPDDLRDTRIEGQGYGLHVPALDADLSIPQLMADHLGADRMLVQARRAAASRANGQLGGRPRRRA